MKKESCFPNLDITTDSIKNAMKVFYIPVIFGVFLGGVITDLDISLIHAWFMIMVLALTPYMGLLIAESVEEKIFERVGNVLTAIYGFALVSIPYTYGVLSSAQDSVRPDSGIGYSLHWTYLFLPIIGITFHLLSVISDKKDWKFTASVLILSFYYSGYIIFLITAILGETGIIKY